MTRFLPILFAISVPLAAWASLRIVRSPLDWLHKMLGFAVCWLLPVIGPLLIVARMPAGDANRSTGTVVQSDEAAPATLDVPGRAPFSLDAHLMNGNGFPILDWRALDAWAQAGDEVALGRRAWLLHLRDVMGGSAALLETGDAWVLSTCEPNVARAVAVYLGVTRRRIAALLEDVAHFPPGERSIFVAFESADNYYRYIANYYPDAGEFAFSSGIYVNAGCPHFTTPKEELWRLEPTIAHELTHSALAHLQLPLWLNEGIAVTAERQVAVYHADAREAVELIGKHLRFWNAERMQEFWSGESFQRADEGNELSYDLARSIVGLIGREWTQFARFACAARYVDGGAAAAATELKIELGELAAAALNVAPQRGWSPDSAQWKRAGLQR